MNIWLDKISCCVIKLKYSCVEIIKNHYIFYSLFECFGPNVNNSLHSGFGSVWRNKRKYFRQYISMFDIGFWFLNLFLTLLLTSVFFDIFIISGSSAWIYWTTCSRDKKWYTIEIWGSIANLPVARNFTIATLTMVTRMISHQLKTKEQKICISFHTHTGNRNMYIIRACVRN